MTADNSEPDVQRPEVLAALLAVGHLSGRAAEAVPVSAAWWIVEGFDGVETVTLAGLTGEDTYDVRDALRVALEAMGIALPSAVDAYTVVFDDLARRCLDGRTSERSLVSEIEQIYIDSDYAEAVVQQPLGRTYGFDDEWGGGWGRTDEQLAADVRLACREQLRIVES